MTAISQLLGYRRFLLGLFLVMGGSAGAEEPSIRFTVANPDRGARVLLDGWVNAYAESPVATVWKQLIPSLAPDTVVPAFELAAQEIVRIEGTISRANDERWRVDCAILVRADTATGNTRLQPSPESVLQIGRLDLAWSIRPSPSISNDTGPCVLTVEAVRGADTGHAEHTLPTATIRVEESGCRLAVQNLVFAHEPVPLDHLRIRRLPAHPLLVVSTGVRRLLAHSPDALSPETRDLIIDLAGDATHAAVLSIHRSRSGQLDLLVQIPMGDAVARRHLDRLSWQWGQSVDESGALHGNWQSQPLTIRHHAGALVLTTHAGDLNDWFSTDAMWGDEALAQNLTEANSSWCFVNSGPLLAQVARMIGDRYGLNISPDVLAWLGEQAWMKTTLWTVDDGHFSSVHATSPLPVPLQEWTLGAMVLAFFERERPALLQLHPIGEAESQSLLSVAQRDLLQSIGNAYASFSRDPNDSRARLGHHPDWPALVLQNVVEPTVPAALVEVDAASIAPDGHHIAIWRSGTLAINTFGQDTATVRHRFVGEQGMPVALRWRDARTLIAAYSIDSGSVSISRIVQDSDSWTVEQVAEISEHGRLLSSAFHTRQLCAVTDRYVFLVLGTGTYDPRYVDRLHSTAALVQVDLTNGHERRAVVASHPAHPDALPLETSEQTFMSYNHTITAIAATDGRVALATGDDGRRVLWFDGETLDPQGHATLPEPPPDTGRFWVCVGLVIESGQVRGLMDMWSLYENYSSRMGLTYLAPSGVSTWHAGPFAKPVAWIDHRGQWLTHAPLLKGMTMLQDLNSGSVIWSEPSWSTMHTFEVALSGDRGVLVRDGVLDQWVNPTSTEQDPGNYAPAFHVQRCDAGYVTAWANGALTLDDGQGQRLWRTQAHAGEITGLAVDGSGHSFVTTGADGHAHRFTITEDSATLEVTYEIPGPQHDQDYRNPSDRVRAYLGVPPRYLLDPVICSQPAILDDGSFIVIEECTEVVLTHLAPNGAVIHRYDLGQGQFGRESHISAVKRLEFTDPTTLAIATDSVWKGRTVDLDSRSVSEGATWSDTDDMDWTWKISGSDRRYVIGIVDGITRCRFRLPEAVRSINETGLILTHRGGVYEVTSVVDIP